MNYDFPVSLQPALTKTGKEVPRMKVVVREDTNEPIAAVSNKYRLIEHKHVMDQALDYVKALGNPEKKFHIGGNGAHVVGEFTFMDKTLAVRAGDLVGLRVYIDNTYNAKGSLKVKIGGVRLACLNGMISHRSVFDLNVRHTGDIEIKFPEPEIILSSFQKAIDGFSRLIEIPLIGSQYEEMAHKAKDDGIIPEKALQLLERKEENAWGLYNDFTYHITHRESSRATSIGKINRLNRVGQWFEEQFPIQ